MLMKTSAMIGQVSNRRATGISVVLVILTVLALPAYATSPTATPTPVQQSCIVCNRPISLGVVGASSAIYNSGVCVGDAGTLGSLVVDQSGNQYIYSKRSACFGPRTEWLPGREFCQPD